MPRLIKYCKIHGWLTLEQCYTIQERTRIKKRCKICWRTRNKAYTASPKAQQTCLSTEQKARDNLLPYYIRRLLIKSGFSLYDITSSLIQAKRAALLLKRAIKLAKDML